MESNINDLYSAVLNGDKTAERNLFEQLSVRFQLFANLKIWNEEDAKEIVQEALATIAREYKRVEIQTSFKAWAYKVMDNRILGYIGSRKSNSRLTSTGPNDIDRMLVEPQPDHDLKRQLRECLEKVRKANIRYARIMNLHYQGYKTGEICVKVKVSDKNVYMILSRARALLKQCLKTGELK